METIAIIPARGGSKGIPRKNIRYVAGKPLLVWNVEAARGAESVSRVVVSTDDQEIAAVAAEHGAEVVVRPTELASDQASSEAALLHVLEVLGREESYNPETVVFLQCTSPLTVPQDIDGTVETLLDKKADSAFTASEFHHFLWQEGADGLVEGVNHDKAERQRRQDRRPQYLETGAVYAMRTEGFLKAKHRFFGKTVLHIVPPERVLEIDEMEDLRKAESALARAQVVTRAAQLPSSPSAVVFDFDGVFTDNRVIVSESGEESVICSRGDGMGIARLKKLGIPTVVLSSETNAVVAARCKKLGIECVTGLKGKLQRLHHWAETQGVDLSEAVYLGNDVNDIECLKEVGYGVAVGDAHDSVLPYANIKLAASGGQHAVRELVDLIEITQGAK